jgi:hypothetical protein
MTSARYDLASIGHAAALRTVGFRTVVTMEENLTKSACGPATRALHFVQDQQASDARRLCTGIMGKDPADKFRLRATRLQFRYGLAACLSLELLERWLAGGPPPFLRIHEEGLAELSLTAPPPPERFTPLPHSIIPASPQSLPFIASAIVCGFYPRPFDGTRVISLLHESAIEPGLRLEMIGQAEASLAQRERHSSAISRPIGVHLAAPDEHPFLYARTALYHLAALRAEETAASKNRIGLFAGSNGRTALVSRQMLDGHETNERNLDLFLKGRLV